MAEGYKFVYLGNVVLDVHLVKNSGTVVSGRDFTIWRDHDFIHTVGSEGSSQSRAHGLGGENVSFDGLDSGDSVLLLLIFNVKLVVQRIGLPGLA